MFDGFKVSEARPWVHDLSAVFGQRAPGERETDRAAFGEGQSVEAGGQGRGLGKGPLHAAHQIGDYRRRDAQLAVGEMLDQYGGNERVVGRGDADRGSGPQAGGKVGKRDRPGRGRVAGDDLTPPRKPRPPRPW